MSLVYQNSFTAFSVGDTPDFTDLGITAVNGAPIIYGADSGDLDGKAMRCTAGGTAVQNACFLLEGTGYVAISVLFKNLAATWPAAYTPILGSTNGATILSNLRVQAKGDPTLGQLQTRNGTTQNWFDTGAGIPTQHWLRLLYEMDATNSLQRVSVYDWNTSTLLLTSGWQSYTAAVVSAVNWGVSAAVANYDFLYDRVRIDDAADPGTGFSPLTCNLVLSTPTMTTSPSDSCGLTTSTTGGDGSASTTLSVISGPSLDVGQIDDPFSGSTFFQPGGGAGAYQIRATTADSTGSASDTETVTVTEAQRIMFNRLITKGG